MKILKFIIWFLFVLSIIAIYIIEFKYSNTVERWDYGAELGKVISNLSLAFIASGIFYILLVYFPRLRDKKYIYKHASQINFSIFLTGSSLFKEINRTDKFVLFKEIEKEDFFKICETTGPNDLYSLFITPDIQHPINYRQRINSIRISIERDIKILFSFIPHLEKEHIYLLNDLLYCQLMRDLDSYFNNEKYSENDTSFEHIKEPLYDFYKKVISLRKYNMNYEK